jgi:hypothetical protein
VLLFQVNTALTKDGGTPSAKGGEHEKDSPAQTGFLR